MILYTQKSKIILFGIKNMYEKFNIIERKDIFEKQETKTLPKEIEQIQVRSSTRSMSILTTIFLNTKQ